MGQATYPSPAMDQKITYWFGFVRLEAGAISENHCTYRLVHKGHLELLHKPILHKRGSSCNQGRYLTSRNPVIAVTAISQWSPSYYVSLDTQS